MNSGITASLICPACGQAFLSMHQGAEGMVQCPHCAQNAQRGEFGTQAQVAAVAQVRRRFAQATPVQSMPAPFVPPPQPQVQASMQPAVWPGLQPQVTVRPTLHYSPALMPTGEPPPQPDEFRRPPHLRASPWRGAFLLLAFVIVGGGVLWMFWGRNDAPAVNPEQAAAPLASPTFEVRKAQPVPVPETPRVVEPPPDMEALTADAKALVNALFAADTPERRAACIHDAGKYKAEIEAEFGGAGEQKTELKVLSRISGMPLMLPGGRQIPLFKLVTSKCANGALIRLEAGADGKNRISWPLLFETHSAALAIYVQQPAGDAVWMHVGLRPSHGLDVTGDLRAKYLTFDVQVSASSTPHFVACVERDTPLARFMDRETEWGRAYLARLLIRKLDVPSEVPCLLVIDCEGAQER